MSHTGICFPLFISPDTQIKVFLACHAQQVLAGVHMLARYGPMQMHQVLEQESVEQVLVQDKKKYGIVSVSPPDFWGYRPSRSFRLVMWLG